MHYKLKLDFQGLGFCFVFEMGFYYGVLAVLKLVI